jgi:hypothetical protein
MKSVKNNFKTILAKYFAENQHCLDEEKKNHTPANLLSCSDSRQRCGLKQS